MLNVYLFGWPSRYGGADTKVAHLIPLLADQVRLTVVPNDPAQLGENQWTDRLDQWGVNYMARDQLADRLDGIALAICNGPFLSHGIYSVARQRGLRVVWSSEMMWHHDYEVDLLQAGAIDGLLCVSPIQQSALNYSSLGSVPTAMVGNYIDPEAFPFVDRRDRGAMVLGRLSRADPLKYPENFPAFYEALEVPHARFRVMAWSEKLRDKYSWHNFDDRWDLLDAETESSTLFLQSLDLFVYPLGHEFVESWGRSTVEAMLTGAIPLVPCGHHLEHLVIDGETGIVCRDFLDYKRAAHRLHDHPAERHAMSVASRQQAIALNDPENHRRIWLDALHGFA